MKQKLSFMAAAPWLVLSLLIFLLDMGSKFWIVQHFNLYDSINLLPFFSITYVRNYGAAFSILWDQRFLLAIVASVVSIAIVVMLCRDGRSDKWSALAYSLILAGALGNLFDRLYHGFVVDFLDVNFGAWHYPTFNIADISVCCGAGLLILHAFIYGRKQKISAADKKS